MLANFSFHRICQMQLPLIPVMMMDWKIDGFICALST